MSENAIMVANLKSVSFKSKKLNEVTKEISGYITEVQSKAQSNHIFISKALARVATEKLFEDDGFKSAIEYAMDTFGWKRANAYAMIQVGTKLNLGQLPEGNFSVSQYREMLTLSKEDAEKAIKDGIITEDMTAKEIREEVEVIKPKKERKEKEEKVFLWYMDGVPGRNDLKLPESFFVDGEGAEWTLRVSSKIRESKVFGYLVATNGEVHFFARGEETK